MSTRNALLRLLSDGHFHSGTHLGQTLGVSRAAVCKTIKSLGETGVNIHRVSGRGYRLEQPFVPLDRQRILAELQGLASAPILGLEVLEETDSTSSHLLQGSVDGSHGRVCLAEAQREGRGRRGRRWVATPWRNILMSMAWRFEQGPASLVGLSLAAGVAAVHALQEYGVSGVGLKWPNDLLWRERKLAGLLVDIRGEAAGPCCAVLGLGLNVHLDPRDAAAIDQPWVDLHALLNQTIDRNRLAALLIHHFREMFRRFESDGLAAFRGEWETHHCYAQQRVCLLQGDTQIDGNVHGIDDSGALLIRDASGELRRFHSGEISLRAAVSPP
jgi:BirA family transcriptional regulator, biotin operon repressor / biotin---[acetyl-CoA-carboxylase] ligase